MYLIAPLTSYNNRVRKHLKIVFPNKSIKEINKITLQHWFMLGQTIGEMPHINNLIRLGNLETEGLERIKKGPAILVGAHMGNWEFLLRVGDLAGRRAGYVFRPINNWILNKIQIYRNKDANADFYRKGRLAAIGMASKLKKGEVVMGKNGKPVKTPDEYEEVTESNSRIYKDEFNDPEVIDGIKVDEIIEEVREAPPIKKAGGGIARMLGE